MRLVAQTGIISIHGHVGIQDCLWEVVDVGEEGKILVTNVFKVSIKS